MNPRVEAPLMNETHASPAGGSHSHSTRHLHRHLPRHHDDGDDLSLKRSNASSEAPVASHGGLDHVGRANEDVMTYVDMVFPSSACSR